MKKTNLLLTLGLTLAVVLTGCGGGSGGGETESAAPADAPAPTAAPSGPTGAVTGTISYANGDPDAEIQMGADPQCDELHAEPVESEQFVVENGKLANVFVYVKEGVSGSYPAPAAPHELDQKGCRYTPHVSGLMVGQTLAIRNSDGFLHNVNAQPDANDGFNNAQPFSGVLDKTFDEVEVMIPFKCDVHPWMAAYVGVLDHPFFAVSGTDGTYTIDDLPPGDYVIEAWHEELGTKTTNVTVAADTVSSASFDYSPAAG